MDKSVSITYTVQESDLKNHLSKLIKQSLDKIRYYGFENTTEMNHCLEVISKLREELISLDLLAEECYTMLVEYDQKVNSLKDVE